MRAICPHGRPIPRGECCAKLQREIRPLAMSLSQATALALDKEITNEIYVKAI